MKKLKEIDEEARAVNEGGEVCIGELRDSWIRCLLIIECLLKQTRIGLADESIRSLRESVICLALQFDDVLVRRYAISCLSVYALMDRKVRERKRFCMIHFLSRTLL